MMNRTYRILCFTVTIQLILVLCGDGLSKEKLPCPSDAAQRQALETIREVYGRDWENRQTAAQKQVLAKTLLAKAAESVDDTNRYVLLKTAQDVASRAGDIKLAFEAIALMARRYQINAYELQEEALAQAAKSAKSQQRLREIVDKTLGLISQAIEKDDFATTKRLEQLALDTARRGKDLDLVKQVVTKNKATEELAQEFTGIQDAVKTLKENPVEPEANATVGRYYCFAKNDWDRGLPMLALGNDAALTKLALIELRRVSDAIGQTALADQWWVLAEENEGPARERLRHRAAYWYNKALPSLKGLSKDRVAKRLQVASEQRSRDSKEQGKGETSVRAQPATPLAELVIGMFQVVAIKRKSGIRKSLIWEFRKDGSVAESGKSIGTWKVKDIRIVLSFSDESLGQAVIKRKRRRVLTATNIRKNGEHWIMELQPLVVVAVWKHRVGDGGPLTIKMWSNGRINTPESNATWQVVGNRLTMKWPNGCVENCRVSPDGCSYKGTNQYGTIIEGTLIPQGK